MQELKEPLSERELEILRLVATGAANKEIARQLVISPNTVKVHLRNIFAKVGVASRTEATLYALNIGLIKPGTESAGEPVETTVESFDGFSASGAAIVDETASGAQHVQVRAWQIGLGLFIVVLLLLAGVAGSRWIRLPAPTPTAASQQQVVVQNAAVPRWSQMADLPAPRKSMGVVEYENSIYIVGGETSSGIDGALLRYDLAQNSWEPLADKPTPVSDIQAALLGEKIYIPGGLLQNGQPVDVLEVYDPRTNSWQTKASLPVPLSAYALAAFEGRLYLFGGKHGDTYSASVYSYDPQEDLWEEQSPLSSPRAYAGTAVINGKIFVTGGYDGEHAVSKNEAYFPNRDESGENAWEEFAPLPEGRYGMGVTGIAAFIVTAGGKGEDGQENVEMSVLQYIPLSNQWSVLNAPPQTVGAFPGLVSSGNFVYVLGGEQQESLSDDNQAYQAIYTISAPIIGGE